MNNMEARFSKMANIPQIVDKLQHDLGRYVRRLRLARNLSVEAVAETTDLAEKSVRNLESGRGSTTETLFKVLTAVEASRLLKILTPADVPVANGATPCTVQVRQRARRLPTAARAAK
jgi:transcriptional regulator with XRE-family HTH domain